MPGIVVGVDGSTGSHKALEWATREVAAHHAPLTVVTVHPIADNYWTGSPLSPDVRPQQDKIRQAAQDAADKVTSELGDQQPASVTVQAVNGIIAEELLRASRDAEMLVVGSRGGGGFSALRLGSVSAQVTEHTPCPVLVVPS
jgi:nucleotide-binding universal stress UspA family protein